MKQPKFKVGDVILYTNGPKNEIGIVKSVVAHEATKRYYLKQDGLHGEPSGEEYTEIEYKYFVNYHTGDTAACTPEELMKPFVNTYAYTIIRRKADSSSIDDTPARQWAAKILEDSSLKGDAYYKEEDRITAILNGDA